MQVGFIGLGNMGAPMAGFVRQAGFSLVVHDLRRNAAGPLLERGAVWRSRRETWPRSATSSVSACPGRLRCKR